MEKAQVFRCVSLILDSIDEFTKDDPEALFRSSEIGPQIIPEVVRDVTKYRIHENDTIWTENDPDVVYAAIETLTKGVLACVQPN